YRAACPKFEAASQLVTSPGSLLNLGDCYEHLGRTASAWTKFGEAAAVAARSGRPEVKGEALQRQAALEPVLMRLAVRLANPVAGFVLQRDGVALAEAAWGEALPVDPGEHVLKAEAPDHQPWRIEIELARPGETVTVDVPALVPSPAAQRRAAE